MIGRLLACALVLLSACAERDDPPSATVAVPLDRPVDGHLPGAVQSNCQLANRSPAVSRWQLRIQGDSGINGTLNLDNLDDIEILLTYTFGQPQTFQFPVFPQ